MNHLMCAFVLGLALSLGGGLGGGLGLGPGPALAQDRATNTPLRHIVVSGQGSIAAAPDMAEVTLGVTAEAPAAQDAMAQVSQDVAAILGILADFGLSRGDVQTTQLRLDPVFENRNESPPGLRGYMARNDVTIALRDLDQLGMVLEAVLAQGANRLSALRFGLADPGPVEAQARRAAVADARQRAMLYADAAGVALGPVLSIVEGGAHPQPMQTARMAMDSGVPVAAGSLDVTAGVTITYGIAD